MKWFSALLALFTFSLISCEKFALLTTAAKKAQTSNTPLAQHAEQYFWESLHQGQYQNIDKLDYLLMAAYLQNPDDPKLAAHLGFTHLWKLTERARLKTESPLITQEIILANKFFSDALTLDPNNPIYQGFYGDTQLIEGTIFKDKAEEIKGYFALKNAIKNWPEFNYFTAGYPMSSLPANSDHFKEALDWQWKTLDLCAGININRQDPSFKNYLSKETQTGKQRACWNSSIAPHNFEGFFMNMGDMLVKQGDWQTAIKIYQNAKLAKDYSLWPFKDLLESRIENAKENVGNFQKDLGASDKRMIFSSGYGCVVCHQQ